MTQFDLFLLLFGILAIVAFIFEHSSIPLSLFLLLTGMLLTTLPFVPRIGFNPSLILDIFLPLLIYDMTSDTGWKEIKRNLRPILLLSLGHIIFITGLVAIVVHALVPELGWPVAFIIGAAVSPPDDVAIVPIIEKGYLPPRLATILKSEALFNDSMALILFRFSLMALITHQFSLPLALIDFSFLIVGEILYGIALGFLLGYTRSHIREPRIQVITSLLSPFIAYLPAVRLGGCGVLATAVMGIVIRHRFFHDFSPEARLISQSVWSSLSFAIQGILFLLVGLDLRFILEGITAIPLQDLLIYTGSVVFTVIIGRFVWVFSFMSKSTPPTPWQYNFIVSWAGMRGSISLAAVLAVPHLSLYISHANVRDLIIFLVFGVILSTLLLQGLTLPWLAQKIGLSRFQQLEKNEGMLCELYARIKLQQAVLSWLSDYKLTLPPDAPQGPQIKFYKRKYQIALKRYQKQIESFQAELMSTFLPDPFKEDLLLGKEILEIERSELARLWQEDEISHAVRNKLLSELDHRSKKYC